LIERKPRGPGRSRPCQRHVFPPAAQRGVDRSDRLRFSQDRLPQPARGECFLPGQSRRRRASP